MMYKILLITILSTLPIIVTANQKIELYYKDTHITYEHKDRDLKIIKTINEHPSEINKGVQKYKGVPTTHFKKLIKGLDGVESVVIIDKSGDYAVEMKAQEFFAKENIIAFFKNDLKIKKRDKGNQIIYTQETLNKYPQLKHRNFWCWWVKAIVFLPAKQEIKTQNVNIGFIKRQKTAKLFFPKPYGNSTISKIKDIKSEYLYKFETKNSNRLEITGLHGNTVMVDVEKGNYYIRKDPKSFQSGGISLFLVKEEALGDIKAFEDTHFFIRSIKGHK